MKPMHRHLSVFVATLSLLGCASDESADQRLARLLSIDPSVKLTEDIVAKRVLELLPIGTEESEIELSAARLGFEPGNLCSYSEIPNRRMSVLRCEFDVKTLAVTKSQWVISLSLSSERRLKYVEAKRYITGL
jgi:lipoprotein NlpI